MLSFPKLFQDDVWKKMECERPHLYDEALAVVSPPECSGPVHVECVKNSNRYRDLSLRKDFHSTNSISISQHL